LILIFQADENGSKEVGINQNIRYKILISLCLPVLILTLSGMPAHVLAFAPDSDQLHRSVGQPKGTLWLTENWAFHHGDSLNWANPLYDDSHWHTTDARIDPDDYPEGGWQGMGWYRQWIDLDENKFRPPYGLMMLFSGACDVYIDGKLVHKVGRPDLESEEEIIIHYYRPLAIPINIESGKHLIAIRYSNSKAHKYFNRANNRTGFWFWVGEARQLADLAHHRTRTISKYLYFFTGAAVAFALLHFLLFLYFPAERGNLYYAIHTIGIAALTYIGFSTNFVQSPDLFFAMMLIFRVSIILAMVYALRFSYSVFYERSPSIFTVFAIISVLLAIFCWFVPLWLIYIYTMTTFIEMLRIIAVSIFRKKRGAFIVGIGLVALIIGATYQIVGDLGFLPEEMRVETAYLYGVMAFLVSMSILLARNSAITKQVLSAQLVHVRELSEKSLEQERFAKKHEMERLKLQAENERKERELEMAKERQSMITMLEEANKELTETNKDLRDTQAQLVQSEKMASLGSLVAGIAHEINTPIGAVASMHDTLLRGIEKLKTQFCVEFEDEQKSANFDKVIKVIDDSNGVIHNGIDRVTTIVRRLRSFARLDEAELKEANIEEGLEDTLTLIHHEIKHAIEIERNYSNVGSIACYPGRLNQVFLNIINNARQAIETEGKITIQTSRDEKNVYIKISDTGSGIPEENLSKIFDPGFTTKGVKIGTGLGLSISYKIIEEHHGRISVESKQDKGTTFTLQLPVNLGEILDHT